MSMNKPMNRVGAAAALALFLALLPGLSGCEGQVPQTRQTETQSTATAAPAPNLTAAQEARIRKSIGTVLDQANASKDPAGLAQRVSGPQLEIRTSELTIAKATGQLDPKTTIPATIAQTVIPGDPGWPRSVFSITTTTQDQQSKRLLILDQESAHENYKLWGVARLFQGAQLPKFPVDTIGARMGQGDDQGLKATPVEAVSRYADLLQNPQSSKYAEEFAQDDFRTSLGTLTQVVQQGIEANKGSQSQTFTPAQGQLRVMHSSDGGDLVVARIDSVWTRQAGEGRESSPASDAEKALFGQGKPTSTMKVTYVNVIALYVPSADSHEPIRAVGAEREPIKVEAV